MKYYEQQKNELKAQKDSLNLLVQGIKRNQDTFTNDDVFDYHSLLRDYLAQRSALLTENKQLNKQNSDSTSNYEVQENNVKLESLQMQELAKAEQEQTESHQKLNEIIINIQNLIDINKANTITAPKTGVLHINEQYKNDQYYPRWDRKCRNLPNIKATRDHSA